MDLPPTGTHLGAQADRSSLVYNFYKENTTFLYPMVMETRLSNGIAGSEFPGLYFLLGKVFQVTGYNYAIYRVFFFIFFVTGFFSAFYIAKKYLDISAGLLVALAIFLSPILTFYSANFLVDMPAFGLSMLGWAILLGKRNKKMFVIIAFLLFGLAGLLKASYAMHLVVAGSIFILEKRKIKWEVVIAALISTLAIGLWYEWATHLNEVYQNPHFLLKTNPSNSFTAFLNLIKDTWNNWGTQNYSVFTFIVLIAGIWGLLQIRKVSPYVFKISSRLLFTSVAFYLVFQVQFKYHDYYFIAFYPLFFFLLLSLLLWLKKTSPNLLFAKLILVIVVLLGYNNTKTMYAERYKPDSYWYMPPMPGVNERHIGIDQYLDKILPEDAAIIVANDNTPNTSLFFARRRGARIADDFSDELKKEIFTDKRFPYALINDNGQYNLTYFLSIGLKAKEIGAYNEVIIYQLQ